MTGFCEPTAVGQGMHVLSTVVPLKATWTIKQAQETLKWRERGGGQREEGEEEKKEEGGGKREEGKGAACSPDHMFTLFKVTPSWAGLLNHFVYGDPQLATGKQTG